MTQTILPHELPLALNRAPEGIEVLSLDCFDTLLWRDCHAPADVFAALPGVLPGQRMVAEKMARKTERVLRARSEVGLEAIYAQAMPNASIAQRGAAIEAELEPEARACFAFAPTVDLMRAAKARGLSVIIVSDTYLDAAQLHTLIARSAGEDVASLIDRVFVSSEAGLSKSQGLLGKVMRAMKCDARAILHIGDNKVADHDSARALSIPALHLDQFPKAAQQRLRLERSCQQMIGERGRGVRGLQPHRALLAQDEPQIDDPAQALGATVLGPVLTAFDLWLRGESETLASERGGTVHWLFMLRDGHLPHLVHHAGGEAGSVARVEISRFTAIAASLADSDTYERQRTLEFGLNPSTLARQMLLEEDEIDRIVGAPEGQAELADACRRLDAELKAGRRRKLTARRARERGGRLIAHVRAACDPQPGDTLMLVDLGYNGSAQDRIDGLLGEAFGVHVAGRYLLLREKAATGLDKAGMLDAQHFDPEWLEALCGNVAVIEQLATCELGSVVDYADAGDPVRTASTVKGAQSEVRDRVQAGAVRFAKAAHNPPIIRCEDHHAHTAWRSGAAGVLSRFLFIPQPAELDVLRAFEHDVNLGSDRMLALFDPKQAREGLQRRGLFYMKGAQRMFLPAELAGESIDMRLSLFVQKRFALGLTYTDATDEKLTIPMLHVGKTEGSRSMVEASATHGGFIVARVPVSPDVEAIALQMGAVFDWFELASVTCSPVASLTGKGNVPTPRECVTQVDGAREHAPGLFECTDASAFVLVNAPPRSGDQEPTMLEFVLKPVRMKPAVEHQQTGVSGRMGAAA